VLGVYAGESGVFQDKEVTLLEEAALDVAFALEHLVQEEQRQRAEEENRSARMFLDLVIDLSPFAMWVSDRDGTVVRANRSLCDTIHLTEDRIVGKYNVFQDANLELQGVMPLVRAVYEKHEPARFHIPWLASGVGSGDFADARDLHLDASMFPILSAQGDLTHVVCQWVDITERKRAEVALHHREEEFRAMFEVASIGMAQADVHTGQWLRVNRKMCQITGYSEAEMLQMRVPEITHPEDRAHDWELFQGVIRGEAPDYRVEKRYLRKDAAVLWVSVNMTVIRDALGEPVRTMATIEDITERKRMEEQQRTVEALLRQQQRLESIGTLAGGVAHEINNPLNGIMNYAQLIQDRLPVGSPLAEFTQEILSETQRVAGIVRGLLTFSRNDKQGRSPARLADIIEGTLSLIRTIIRHDQIQLTVAVPDGLPTVRCRSQQIQQVVMNLVTNARDALNERYPGADENKVLNLEARLLQEEGQRWVRLTVEDHGTGITPEVRERMFDPFFTTKPREKGTGLGLSISHGIVKEHQGKLTADSEPGRYTRFCLDLPVDREPDT
jgi:PAS domain S-box-containing protein